MERKPEIIALAEAIEKVAGEVTKSPSGFAILADKMAKEKKIYVSDSTLKRIFGYVSGYNRPQTATLDALSKYAGYKNWADFCSSIGKIHYESSDYYTHNTLQTNVLHVGQELELTWFPDRFLTIKYLGEQKFIIEKSVNSKLKDGFTFKCNMFIIGEPLYFYEVNDVKNNDYKAARQGGLSTYDVLE